MTFAYLYDHPEIVQQYLEMHPDKYEALEAYFQKRKANAKYDDQVEKYEEAEEAVGINAKTITEQLDLENNNPDFYHFLQMLAQISISIDSAQIMQNYSSNNCSPEVAKTLVSLSSKEFNTTINPYLPKINSLENSNNTIKHKR